MDQNTSSSMRTAIDNVAGSRSAQSKFVIDSKQRSTNSMPRDSSKAYMGVVLKTLYPGIKTNTFSNTRLERPPLPHMGMLGPPPSKYNPNKEFVSVKNRVSTISKDARFDSLKDVNKREREQVSPLSYKINTMTDIHRPLDK